MKIKLEYTDATSAAVERSEIEEDNCQSIEDSVRSLIQRFPKEFSAANPDIERVIVDGVDLGISGIYQAESALAKFYTYD